MSSQTDSQTDSQTNPQCPNDDESKTERLLRHLANARAKARAHGLSPRERAAQKFTAALTWLYRWEWCAPAPLDATANDTRGGYPQRLKRAGLVHITEIIGSPGTRHRPRHAVSLTSAGVERATEAITEESQIRGEVKTGVRAVPQHQIEHDHRLQLLVPEWLQIDMVENYLTPGRTCHPLSGSRKTARSPCMGRHAMGEDRNRTGTDRKVTNKGSQIYP